NVGATCGSYEKFLGAEATRFTDKAVFSLGELTLRIHKTYEPVPGYVPGEDHIAFEVENVDEACEELVLRGLTVEIGPRDFDWGRSAYLRDPDGRMLELHQT
ncbi:MAG: VOC family protein, partial [Candidatus Geothermarchaeales archaeon]